MRWAFRTRRFAEDVGIASIRAVPVPTLSDGIDGPDDPERARRLERSKLLKRTFAIDVLTCSRCLG
jgi:hypothetical protein